MKAAPATVCRKDGVHAATEKRSAVSSARDDENDEKASSAGGTEL